MIEDNYNTCWLLTKKADEELKQEVKAELLASKDVLESAFNEYLDVEFEGASSKYLERVAFYKYLWVSLHNEILDKLCHVIAMATYEPVRLDSIIGSLLVRYNCGEPPMDCECPPAKNQRATWLVGFAGALFSVLHIGGYVKVAQMSESNKFTHKSNTYYLVINHKKEMNKTKVFPMPNNEVRLHLGFLGDQHAKYNPQCVPFLKELSGQLVHIDSRVWNLAGGKYECKHTEASKIKDWENYQGKLDPYVEELLDKEVTISYQFDTRGRLYAYEDVLNVTSIKEVRSLVSSANKEVVKGDLNYFLDRLGINH